MTEPTASAPSQLITDSEAAASPVDKFLNDRSAGSNRFLCWNHVVNVTKSFSSLICQLVVTRRFFSAMSDLS